MSSVCFRGGNALCKLKIAQKAAIFALMDRKMGVWFVIVKKFSFLPGVWMNVLEVFRR